MATRIEGELGREALVDTIETGPISFIQTYNAIAEDGMKLHFAEPENEPITIYQELRSAALDGDLDQVRAVVGQLDGGGLYVTDFNFSKFSGCFRCGAENL